MLPNSPSAVHDAAMTEFELVGVPYTSMAEPGGIANAISVFRDLDLAERLARLGVEDGGDMELKEPSGTRGPSGLLNEQALDHLVQTTHTTVHAVRDRGRVPLMVGGDCPVLLGGLASIGPGTGPGLVMVDGHEDAWPPSLSDTGEASDSELGIALGLISDLPPTLARWTPLVAGPRVAVLGPRDSDELPERGVASVAPQLGLFHDERQVRERGPERAASEALDAIGEGEFWLHIDLDVLTSADFPAADYLQPGGLSWSELQELATTVMAGEGLAGVSVVIYNPDRDPGLAVAPMVVDFVVRIVEERT
jgi:arginase